jgi:two-component system chemotaxis response regulator CheY
MPRIPIQGALRRKSGWQGGMMTKQILVVDDSKTVRNLVAFILKNEGFKVTAAEDGLDGLEKLYSMPHVDLILSDVNMPRMDGFTFIRTVREQPAYRDVPIIVLSTEGQEKDIQTGMGVGDNLYMVKPAQPENMVRNIKMLLG